MNGIAKDDQLSIMPQVLCFIIRRSLKVNASILERNRPERRWQVWIGQICRLFLQSRTGAVVSDPEKKTTPMYLAIAIVVIVLVAALASRPRRDYLTALSQTEWRDAREVRRTLANGSDFGGPSYASLYTTFRQLDGEGFVETWETHEEGRPKRLFRLTEAGAQEAAKIRAASGGTAQA